MRILLTGATGFIGRHLVEAALGRGHEVAALVRGQPEGRLPRAAGLRLLAGTLQDPPLSAIRAFHPEGAILAAWIATPGSYLTDPSNADYLAWNAALVDALLAAGAGWVMGLGTCIEYAPSAAPLSEASSPLDPRTPYARSKHELQVHLQATAARAGASWAWGRIFLPYGPGEHPERLCSSLARALAAGQTPALRTGESVRDYLHVRDLAQAVLAVVESGLPGPVNLGSGVGTRVAEVARILCEVMGRPGLHLPDLAAADPYPSLVADVDRLRSLGWSPRVALRDGLRELASSLG